MADDLRPTLGETGQIYVTLAAANGVKQALGLQEHEVEAARLRLTELLLDARQSVSDPETWRTRKRSTKLDISVLVKRDGRLFVVTHATAQPYDPPSRTSGVNKPRRQRAPARTEAAPTPNRRVAAGQRRRRAG